MGVAGASPATRAAGAAAARGRRAAAERPTAAG